METFFSFLQKRIDDCSSLLCIGLDPHPEDLRKPAAQSALDFCLNLIQQTAPFAAAFKPNIAFFEVFGADGWLALKEVIEAIQRESDRLGSHIPVILDAKRGDIASTAVAYKNAAFRTLGVDALTLNPYLGWDAIEPFLDEPEKGVFILCKTSNPGSLDLQDEKLASGMVYEHVARQAQNHNTRDNIGLVVGATQLDALRNLREIVPDLWFLVPGVGAQGGEIEPVLEAGLREDGRGMLINVSRLISRSENPRQKAMALRDEIANYHFSHPRLPVPLMERAQDFKSSLADALLESGCIKFGDFTLKSGMKSPIYLDLRQLVSFPALLEQAGAAYRQVLIKLKFDRIAGLPYAAVPIATAISLQTGYPMLYPRKEVKEYGTMAEIEGIYEAGETVVVIDDLATTGGSKFEAIEKLSRAGLLVKDVVVLIDRQSGARQALAEAGYRLHSVLILTEMLDHWEKESLVAADLIDKTRKFLSGD